MKNLHTRLMLGGVVVFLGGCGFLGGNDEDLQQWMAELRSTTKPRVVTLKEPKQFFPQEYTANGMLAPFDSMRLTQALRRNSKQGPGNSDLIAPELERRKEPLENYPLDTMKMVGSIEKAGVATALLTVDNLLYQVRVGHYLGQNYGKIVAITETGVELREIVQDSSGDWEERMTTLALDIE